MSEREALQQIITLASAALSQPAPTPAPMPTPTPTSPPTAPAPTNNPYPGPNMWDYSHRRLSTGALDPTKVAKGGFTVLPGDVGKSVEIGISGANLNVYVDHEVYLGPFPATLGDHVIAVRTVAPSADGSIDLYHA